MQASTQPSGAPAPAPAPTPPTTAAPLPPPPPSYRPLQATATQQHQPQATATTTPASAPAQPPVPLPPAPAPPQLPTITPIPPIPSVPPPMLSATPAAATQAQPQQPQQQAPQHQHHQHKQQQAPPSHSAALPANQAAATAGGPPATIAPNSHIPSIDQLRGGLRSSLGCLDAPNLTTYIEHYHHYHVAGNCTVYQSPNPSGVGGGRGVHIVPERGNIDVGAVAVPRGGVGVHDPRTEAMLAPAHAPPPQTVGVYAAPPPPPPQSIANAQHHAPHQRYVFNVAHAPPPSHPHAHRHAHAYPLAHAQSHPHAAATHAPYPPPPATVRATASISSVPLPGFTTLGVAAPSSAPTPVAAGLFHQGGSFKRGLGPLEQQRTAKRARSLPVPTDLARRPDARSTSGSVVNSVNAVNAVNAGSPRTDDAAAASNSSSLSRSPRRTRTPGAPTAPSSGIAPAPESSDLLLNDWEHVVSMYMTGEGTTDGRPLREITRGDGRRVEDRKLLEKRRTIGKTYERLGRELFECAIGYKLDGKYRRKQRMYHVIARCRVVNGLRKAGETLPTDAEELSALIDRRLMEKAAAGKRGQTIPHGLSSHPHPPIPPGIGVTTGALPQPPPPPSRNSQAPTQRHGHAHAHGNSRIPQPPSDMANHNHNHTHSHSRRH